VIHTARVDPDANRTTSLGDGINQIRLPMRGNPLRYVNAYAVEDGGGLTLIDCGWKTDDVLEALHQGLAAIGATVADIRRLFVTHFHFDHYGLAGTLRRVGIPALGMHPRDWEAVRWLLGDPSGADRASDAWMVRNGFPVPPSDDDVYYRRSELAEPTLLIDDGATYGRLEAIWTPGHSPGHVCFRDGLSGRLLSGDHILDPITPHVGLWFDGRGDPLGEYMESLHKVRQRGASGVLPAHGEPFPDLEHRVDALLAHVGEREQQVLQALARGPRTAAAVARALKWTRSNRTFEELEELHQQFAVAETLAYLEYSRLRDLVTRDEGVTPILYAPVC
jgi:glyoxylase-like metal-dependent hydrolase (beta-lactamase superfamily II)